MAIKSRKQVNAKALPYVLVRTQSAGVHAGHLVSRKGNEAVLKDGRRIWRWYGANTLSELATSGLETSRSRVSVPVSITLIGVIEVIEVTKTGEDSIKKAGWSA